MDQHDALRNALTAQYPSPATRAIQDSFRAIDPDYNPSQCVIVDNLDLNTEQPLVPEYGTNDLVVITGPGLKCEMDLQQHSPNVLNEHLAPTINEFRAHGTLHTTQGLVVHTRGIGGVMNTPSALEASNTELVSLALENRATPAP